MCSAFSVNDLALIAFPSLEAYIALLRHPEMAAAGPSAEGGDPAVWHVPDCVTADMRASDDAFL